MRPELDEQCVIKASAQFWEQMLAMQLTPLHHEEASLGDRHFTGRVQMSGAWNGLVEVRMSPGLASHATAAMLMQPLETVVESDTLDATREIVNMLAGVIKRTLDNPRGLWSRSESTGPYSESETYPGVRGGESAGEAPGLVITPSDLAKLNPSRAFSPGSTIQTPQTRWCSQ